MLIQNTILCRILLMITKYFRLTNYTWMFCEGYYLHRLLVNTFEEERSIMFILIIGWGELRNVACFNGCFWNRNRRGNFCILSFICRSSSLAMRHVRHIPGAPRRHAVLGTARRVGRVDRVDLHDPRDGSCFTDVMDFIEGVYVRQQSTGIGERFWHAAATWGCTHSIVPVWRPL